MRKWGLSSVASRCTSSLLLCYSLRFTTALSVLSTASAARSLSSSLTCLSASSSSTMTAPTTFADTSESYRQLLTKLQQIKSLEQASAVLHYDQMVSMPAAASAARGAQMGALAAVVHEKNTDPVLRQILAQTEADLLAYKNGPMKQDEQHVVRLAREELDKKQKIPPELEAKRASLSASAYAAWVQARKNNDFPAFQPVLQDCFDTAKKTAEAIRGDDDTSKDVYTVLLDEFERGMPAERIDDIFDQIQEKLVPLLKRVLESENPPLSECFLKGSFDVEGQKKLSRDIVTALGFDETHGRIDVSVHPFTTSFSPSDVRITSRFSDKEWYQGLAGSVHEAGHAMYEQNVGNSNTEVDSFLSMGTHESQSLFWERHIGLSKPFWKWANPLLKKHLTAAADWTPEQVYGAVNTVSPGLIRVEADELTYPLHVILRYQLEKKILLGEIDLAELPERWNQGMKDMLNVDVPSDSDGCLQDVHWSGLAIGYFPTYLIGAATAAQLAHYCEKEVEDFGGKIETGDFAPIKAWLTDKIHRHGRRYKSLDALLTDQLGEPLNPVYLIEYLTKKYTELYQC